jgi:hypothetical protein
MHADGVLPLDSLVTAAEKGRGLPPWSRMSVAKLGLRGVEVGSNLNTRYFDGINTQQREQICSEKLSRLPRNWIFET